MYLRTNYEMTQEDLDAILSACKSTPVMFLSGGTPMGSSPQENANRAWAALGKKMGFDHMTVQPSPGRGERFFSAVPSETPEAQTERLEREAEAQRHAKIEQLRTEISERQTLLEAMTK